MFFFTFLDIRSNLKEEITSFKFGKFTQFIFGIKHIGLQITKLELLNHKYIIMSEGEESHDSHMDREGQSDGEEVVFRESVPDVEGSTSSTKHTASPQMVTAEDLQDVIEGWKTKFQHLSEGICAIRLASKNAART